jgi:hypothetical protein
MLKSFSSNWTNSLFKLEAFFSLKLFLAWNSLEGIEDVGHNEAFVDVVQAGSCVEHLMFELWLLAMIEFDVEDEVAIEEGVVADEFVSNELDDEWNEQHLQISNLFAHFEHMISLTSVMPLILASW